MCVESICTDRGVSGAFPISKFIQESSGSLFWQRISKRIEQHKSGNVLVKITTGTTFVSKNMKNDRPVTEAKCTDHEDSRGTCEESHKYRKGLQVHGATLLQPRSFSKRPFRGVLQSRRHRLRLRDAQPLQHLLHCRCPRSHAIRYANAAVTVPG